MQRDRGQGGWRDNLKTLNLDGSKFQSQSPVAQNICGEPVSVRVSFHRKNEKKKKKKVSHTFYLFCYVHFGEEK